MERPALQAPLQAALLSRKLVLLIAPAGYGKTVALAQQLARLPAEHAVAWMTASPGDGLHSVLTTLLAALDPFDLPWRISPDALPDMAQREHGLADVAAELARTLGQADAEHGVIAIDDVHRVADARVFEFFDLLLPLLPERWTLVMTSRTDPPLPLARMRVTGELAEFREAQLSFDGADVLALLRAHKPDATAEQARSLLASTQGWPVGLTLRLMAEAGVGQSGSHGTQLQRRMFDYLAQEVLEELPSPLQDFVLRCAVLPEWTAARCAQVSGDAHAAHWLDELDRRGLFVTLLDSEEFTLRPHDLFRDFLQWRLQRERAEELLQLLRRAAQGEPDPAARIGYLLRAGAVPEAVKELMRVGPAMIHAGASTDEQVLRIIDEFPPAERDASPELAFLRGLCSWHRYRFDHMGRWMRRALAGAQRSGQDDLAVQAGAVAVVALLVAGEVAEAVELWQGVRQIEANPITQAAREVVEFSLAGLHGPGESAVVHLSRLARLVRQRGELLDWVCLLHLHLITGRWGMRAPMQALIDAMTEAAGEARPRWRLTSLTWSAWLAMWQGDVPAARTLCQQIVEEARWLGDPPGVRVPLQHLTAIEKHLTGDDAAAQELLQTMADEAARTPGRRSQAIYLNLGGAFAAAAHDWPAARAALSVIERIHGPRWPYLEVCAATLRAELALHDRADREARELLHAQLQRAMDSDHFGTHARLRVALARAELRLTERKAAWQVLEPLLSEARVSGETLGLLMCGPAALEELAQARWPANADASLLAVLRGCAAQASRLRTRTTDHVPPAPPDTTLSERERQVLALVAQGQSNKVIARDLGLSPHTVKRHMARMLDKTGQSSRGQLAAWYGRHVGSQSPSR